jgi:hypothetical protein
MSYRLLLDENIEHEVGHRLEHYGHDVVHVDFEPELGKGSTDQSLAAYTRSKDRILVTYDDDFVLSLDSSEFRAAFYLADASLPAETVADIIHEVSKHYPQTEVDGLEHVGIEWL